MKALFRLCTEMFTFVEYVFLLRPDEKFFRRVPVRRDQRMLVVRRPLEHVSQMDLRLNFNTSMTH